MRASSRHSSPLLVRPDGAPLALKRLRLGVGDDDLGRREAFLQELVHSQPAIIPMREIEPAFTPEDNSHLIVPAIWAAWVGTS